jgi:hypothetical protein
VDVVERTKRRSRLLTCAVVWAILLMLWTVSSIDPNAMARKRGGYATGSNTWVQDSAPKTNANVGSVAIPSVLDITNGETVYYEMYYSWDDRRSSGPTATHHFTISVIYPGRPLGYAKQTWKTTDPGEGPFGPLTLTLDIPNCQEGDTVSVMWHVDVSIPGETPASDDSGPHYQYYS